MSAAVRAGHQRAPIPQAIAPVPADVADQAVQWLIELQSEDPPPMVLEQWRRWRAQHPDHDRAWLRIESVNGSLRGLAAPLQSALAHATLMPKRSARRRQAIKALAALVFMSGGAWLVQDQAPWRQWAAQHRTRVGQRETLLLDDGTQLVMNTGSAVDVAFSPTERRIRLLAGEVLATTGRDPQAAARAFLIETAEGEVLALGTRYAVRQLPGATLVSVYEAAVEIRPRQAAGQRLVIHAGQQARFTLKGIETPRSVEESDSAWTQGMIVARGLRLADFLAELSRYSPHPISCDPSVAELRISGAYPLSDIGRVLDTISALLSLEVQHVTRFWGAQSLRLTQAPPRRAGADQT